jgi:hypothetical protein
MNSFKKKVLIKKKSKEFEEFSKVKFKKSLLKAGISQENAQGIFEEIKIDTTNYFTTTSLHNATYKAILKKSKLHAANYNIKTAITNLGPSGYPFEILCAEMLKAKGYKTKVSVMKRGMHVKHEVDIVARRKDHSIFFECKFHNRKTQKNDIKVHLYVNSRFLDIKEKYPRDTFDYGLITNTQFSEDAIKYSKGVGLVLFAMNYPRKNSFIDLIKKYKIYPVTTLKSLRVRDKKKLLDKKIVVIKQVKMSHLNDLGLTENVIVKVLQEIRLLTRPN